MFLQFKSFKKVILSIVLGCFSTLLFAENNCAVINISQSESFIFELAQLDSKIVSTKREDQRREVVGGSFNEYLKPGKRVLSIYQFEKSIYRLKVRNNLLADEVKRRQKQLPLAFKLKTIYLDIKPNTYYQLSLAEDNEHAEIIIKEKSKLACNKPKSVLVLGEKNDEFIDNSVLPVLQEAQFNRLMAKLITYKKGKVKSNVLPIKIDEYFGTIIDNKYTSNNGLRVLTVLPYSLAYKLGLRSNDEILTVGTNKIINTKISPRAVIDNYLLQTEFEDEISFEIQRNQQKLKLIRKYEHNLIPQSSYSIEQEVLGDAIVNSTELTKQLAFEYDRQILALHKYYRAQGITAKQVLIKRDKQRNERIGLNGEAITNKGLKVIAVEKNSILSSLALLKGDVLLYLNDHHTLLDKTSLLIEKLGNLSDGESYNLTIERNGKVVELVGIYQVKYIPAFTVMLDMESIDKGNKLLAWAGRRKSSFSHIPNRIFPSNSRINNNPDSGRGQTRSSSTTAK